MATDQELTRDQHLERARAAYAAQAWRAALDGLVAADRLEPLGLDDLERLGFSAHLVGRDDVAADAGTRAFAVAAKAGEHERAARCAFWAGMTFAYRNELAQAGAWFARAQQQIEKLGRDSVEDGYVLLPVGLRQLDEGDYQGAWATFDLIARRAEQFQDPDLTTLGQLGRGQTLIALGERERGARLLDEAMVGVAAGDVSPSVAGLVYCATVELCHMMFDIRRAREWTAALTAWCDAQPDLVFRGQCLVYRAELARFQGDWSAAADEVRRARAVLAGPPVDPGIGEAHYEEAELHRLQGRLEEAERAYVEASQFGRRPEPGLALLRLAQGRSAAARGIIDRALQERPDDPRLFDAAMTIALAQGDTVAARSFVERLQQAAGSHAPALLEAITARAEGELKLASGEPREALRTLRRAWELWLELDAPYDTARVRVGIARACRALGDAETAQLEIAAARRVFEELGAAPALQELDRPVSGGPAIPNGLSPRELEVLRHLAGGQTNRQIGEELGISERTVDRHVSNLYTKLDVSTRAAATAWAYEHDLA